MANDNKLKKVKDENTILSLLSGAKEKKSEVYLWKLMGSEKHLALVRIESIRKLRKDFCIVPAEEQEKLVQQLMGSDGSVDIYIPDSALVLRCQVKQTEAPIRYYLHLPTFAAQVDRRKNLRLNVHENSEVQVNFGKTVSYPKTMSQHFSKNCFDISSGGFSFFASKMESKFFHVNDPISQIEIKAGKWSSKVSAEIAMITEIEPNEHNGLSYKVWRVNCKFSSIDQISRKYLEKFIFERIKDELHVINE